MCHMITKESLSKLKIGSLAINIDRGPLIDEAALVKALDSSQTKSVDLDACVHEPEISPERLNHKASLLHYHVRHTP